MRVGYLGLGSNVGDREAHIEAAIQLLADGPSASGGTAPKLIVEAVSSLYETEPVGEVLDQADFINAVCRVRTSLDPESLLDLCKSAEMARGRQDSGVRHGPRPLDIDLLLLGDIECVSDRLSLPHPEVRTRRFVLEPLLELDSELSLPDGTRLADCLDLLGPGQRVTRRA